ncbi:MAG: response regulator transcription factor [Clostridia bacterium]|nr:response regulator transcription factor [Clostridia bacterium]
MTDKKNILIADDEAEIREVLELLLTGEGYNVISCADGEEVLASASDNIDLYILDIGMPGMTGLKAATLLRREYDTPIIFLTAYSTESDKVMGFSAGADDYIVKPFSNIELLMRVKAILRRSGTVKAKSNTIILKDLTIDTDSQSVTRAGERINLTYTEYGILVLLASHPKKIYSLDNIYDSIWGDDAVGDSSIMVHIKNLRKKIGDSSREPIYIKTAWGRGYYVD